MANITIDYDDTMNTVFSELAIQRLEFFRILATTNEVYIVTARKEEHTEEIRTFLKDNNIQIKGIIAGCASKVEACKNLKTIAHFDDSERHCKELSENGINSFYCGEFHSTKMTQRWSNARKDQGVWHFYELDNNTRGCE